MVPGNRLDQMAEYPPGSKLLRMLTGNWTAQALYVAAKLGVADHLVDGPVDCDRLAQLTGSHPEALYRLLRALAGLGLFVEDHERRFGLTPLGEELRDNVPFSMRHVAIMLGEEHYAAWGRLIDAVRSGQTAFELLYDQPVFDYFGNHLEAAATFNRAMTQLAHQTHVAVVDAYDFGPYRLVADLGGGHGALLAAILRANPHLRGLLFDLPAVVAGADEFLAAPDVRSRASVAGGDFFEEIPAGCDVYVMSTVIHDWHDEAAMAILGNVRRAMTPDARLLLVERVLKSPNEPDFGKLADLNMLVMTGGLERTADEWRTLLEGSGFRLRDIIPTRTTSCVIEAELATASGA